MEIYIGKLKTFGGIIMTNEENVEINDSEIAENNESKTFYQAYCNTEGKNLGNQTNDRIVAQNTANHHNRNTGHSTTVL
jgi:hypothetical protein